MERPRHAMDAPKDDSYAHGDGNGRIARIISVNLGE